MKRTAIAAIVLSLAGTATVSSQQEQAPRWGVVFYPDPLGSLRVADIQSKLGLSDEQKAAVKQLEVEWLEVRKQLQESRAGLSEKEFAEKQREAVKPFEAKARGLLSEEQQEQLEQIRRRQRAELFSPLLELRRQEMREELSLDEKQKQAIEELHEQWIEKALRLAKLDAKAPAGKTWWASEYARAVFQTKWEFQPRVRSLTNRILRAPQLARLHQIEWQEICSLEGAGVLVRSQVVQYLGLTEEQQKSIRALADESGREERWSKQGLRRRDALHKAVAQLTFFQRIRWNALIGKPYERYRWLFEESAGQEEAKSDAAN